MYTKRVVSIAAACLIGAFCTYAQTPELESTIKEATLPSPPKPEGRPSVALVLSGGGARGFAHIPVLELLEEEHIPIDMIVGNSAGAIGGALYCAGYTPQELLDQMYAFSSGAVLKDAPYSPFEQNLGEHSTLNAPVRITFGSRGQQTFTLGMGNGVLTGQNAYELFKRDTVRIPSTLDFDDLPIPFRAVTTNLITGKLEVLSHGDLAEAMRKSMSIPGVFQPFEDNGNYYLDGLALDDTPVDVAVKMGYDIIIVSTFSDGMITNPDDFDANPLIAVLQMMNMDQAAREKNNRQFVTLNITPDYAKETLISYPRGKKIYTTSKKSMDEYRQAVRDLYKKIYPDGAASADPQSSRSPYKKHYSDNTYLSVDHLVVENADSIDETYIRKRFEKMKGHTFTEKDFTDLSDTIYHTGKYRNVITRITGDEGNRTLEILLRPEKKENGMILMSADMAAACAMDSTVGLSLVTDIQWRGLTGYGSVISARISAFNGFSGEFLFRHPFTARSFTQTTVNYFNIYHNTASGWAHYPASLVSVEKSSFNEKIGYTFSNSKQVVSIGAGISWFNTVDASADGGTLFAGDFSGNYTLNTLDSTCFPTKGTYVSITGTGVLPIEKNPASHIFDIEEADIIKAFPLGQAFNIIIDGFAGTDMSHELLKVPALRPVYGFSLADRRFFPQISSLDPWGLHKAAASITLQFSPQSDLTVFGMKTFLFVSGAAGNIWNSYADISFRGLQWRASFDAGIRIQDNFGILLRLGAGTTRGYVLPFVSLDLGNIRF